MLLLLASWWQDGILLNILSFEIIHMIFRNKYEFTWLLEQAVITDCLNATFFGFISWFGF